MHNLSTVFWFEVIRTLKKKSFWIMSLTFPLMIGAVGAIIYFSGKATDDAATKAQSESFSVQYTDRSGIIKSEIAAGLKATQTDDRDAAIEQVRAGKLDAYFYYPKDVTRQSVEVYGRDVGLFENSRYDGVAKLLVEQSASQQVSPELRTVIAGDLKTQSETYRDGQPHDGIKQLIAPGIFLVLFYILIVTFGNQMMASTTEEKENRVIEMILTTVRARTLIVGKILSLVVLGVLQTVIIMVPTITGYLLLRDRLSLPSFDLSNIPLDPVAITVGALLFAVSFLMFTGLLVTIGAATPTAKEAGGFFGAVMMLVFGPLYAAPLFISAPESPIVQFLSYFPLTAPIPLMLRNAVGNLELWQAGLSIGILLLTTIFILTIAVRVFRTGALEYSRKLSLREIFGG